MTSGTNRNLMSLKSPVCLNRLFSPNFKRQNGRLTYLLGIHTFALALKLPSYQMAVGDGFMLEFSHGHGYSLLKLICHFLMQKQKRD